MPDVQQADARQIITAIGDHGQLYPINKLDAHILNVPHLAVSIFIFNKGRLLMQQRAQEKYHSGGLWANTCCSHPHWQESLPDCADRRLLEEVGFQSTLTPFGSIEYKAAVGDLFENETAHCFAGYMNDASLPIQFNTDEIQTLRWQSLDQLKTDILDSPDDYSPWLRIYMQEHFDMIASVAHRTNAGVSA